MKFEVWEHFLKDWDVISGKQCSQPTSETLFYQDEAVLLDKEKKKNLKVIFFKSTQNQHSNKVEFLSTSFGAGGKRPEISFLKMGSEGE